MKNFYIICSILLTFSAFSQNGETVQFIKVMEGNFVKGDTPYRFAGSNYWQGMNLGAPESGDLQRLVSELDQMESLGLKNLRILGASEADAEMKFAIHPALQTSPGVYNEDLWKGLDILLVEMAKRDMTAVVVLGNFWTWSGGFPQYLKWSGSGDIPYPQEEETSWKEFTDYSKQFYSNAKAQKMMDNHIEKVISRVNHVTGVAYKNDPTIMAWELANEPRAYDEPVPFRKWTRRMSALIKSLDANHLVCLGTEGNTANGDAGVNVLVDNDDTNIDYITMHIWPQNWGWFNTENPAPLFQSTLNLIDAYWAEHERVAVLLNKPIVFEEFGIARDQASFDPEAGTLWRDRIYSHFLDKVVHSIANNLPVQGVNFWTYSGEGRPERPGEFWQKGDVFTGDPPHELQGWYGVYSNDNSTLHSIEEAARKIND